jgi:hypothetical protein
VQANRLVTGALVLFVVASLGYLAYKEVAKSRAAASTAPPAPAAANQDARNQDATPVVTVYYFHTSKRCPTCLAMEAYTREALEQGFAAELETGRLKLVAANLEAAENKALVEAFQLSSGGVVLEACASGERQRWKNLQAAWEHVWEKPVFLDYIQTETRAFIKGDAP